MHYPGVYRYYGDAQGYDYVMDAAATHSRNDKGQQKHGEAHERVHGPHDEHIDNTDTAKVSGNYPQSNADYGSNPNGNKAHHQRRP